jgi:hypothetical protein
LKFYVEVLEVAEVVGEEDGRVGMSRMSGGEGYLIPGKWKELVGRVRG